MLGCSKPRANGELNPLNALRSIPSGSELSGLRSREAYEARWSHWRLFRHVGSARGRWGAGHRWRLFRHFLAPASLDPGPPSLAGWDDRRCLAVARLGSARTLAVSRGPGPGLSLPGTSRHQRGPWARRQLQTESLGQHELAPSKPDSGGLRAGGDLYCSVRRLLAACWVHWLLPTLRVPVITQVLLSQPRRYVRLKCAIGPQRHKLSKRRESSIDLC